MNDTDSLLGRVTLLEELYSHQQRIVQELNEVLVRMQADIDRLTSENNRLREQLRNVVETAGDDLPHEKPPHY